MSEQKQAWVEFYRSAILELDLKKLPAKIQAAREAMDARILALEGSSDSFEERQALRDAQRNLRMLQKNEGDSY